MESVQKQLEALGLSPNEVKAYLASLEIGAATAQQIAAKAAVVRPTAYVAIGGLVKRGLMSSHTRGKKQYFLAERPGRLLHLVDEEKKSLADRESKLKSILPGLEALITIAGEKPEVKYYEGLEGLEAMRAMLYASNTKNIDVIACSERVRESLSEETRVMHDFRLKKKNIPGRQINIIDNARLYSKPSITQDNWKIKCIKRQGFKFRGEIAAFDDNIVLVVYMHNPLGIVVKSKDLAAVFEVLFNLAWQSGRIKDLRL